MLTLAQSNVLDSLIGNEGNYFETIRDYTGADWGTKALYLERAITQNEQEFMLSLDKLDLLTLIDKKARTENLDFIHSLKIINDICFDNEVKFDNNGLKSALKIFFGTLDKKEAVIDTQAIRIAVQSTINAHIAQLLIEHPEIPKQREERIVAETKELTDWRTFYDVSKPKAAPAAPQVNIPPVMPRNLNAHNPQRPYSSSAGQTTLFSLTPTAQVPIFSNTPTRIPNLIPTGIQNTPPGFFQPN